MQFGNEAIKAGKSNQSSDSFSEQFNNPTSGRREVTSQSDGRSLQIQYQISNRYEGDRILVSSKTGSSDQLSFKANIEEHQTEQTQRD